MHSIMGKFYKPEPDRGKKKPSTPRETLEKIGKTVGTILSIGLAVLGIKEMEKKKKKRRKA